MFYWRNGPIFREMFHWRRQTILGEMFNWRNETAKMYYWKVVLNGF
jgi:hypothetical protein